VIQTTPVLGELFSTGMGLAIVDAFGKCKEFHPF